MDKIPISIIGKIGDYLYPFDISIYLIDNEQYQYNKKYLYILSIKKKYLNNIKYTHYCFGSIKFDSKLSRKSEIITCNQPRKKESCFCKLCIYTIFNYP